MTKNAARRAAVSRPKRLAPAAPPALLAWLFLHGDDRARVAVVRHPDCPLIVLEMLAGDDDHAMRAAVANHPRCPVATREALSQREGE